MHPQHLAMMIVQSARQYADHPAMNTYSAGGEGPRPGPISSDHHHLPHLRALHRQWHCHGRR